MRSLSLALLTVLAAASQLDAQTAQPAAQPDAKVLLQWRDYVLQNWEKSIAQVQSLEAECQHIVKDKTFGTQELYIGTARFLKANTERKSQASLELKKVVNNKFDETNFKKYVCTGNFFYEYVPQLKVIRQHELPTGDKGQIIDDNVFSFIFGMKAADAVQRYDIAFVPPSANDTHYHYLVVRPKTRQQMADFQEARISILKDGFMIRQLWFLQPNGSEVTWDLPKINTKVNLSPTDFAPPRNLPAGWQMEVVRHNAAAPQQPAKIRFGNGQ